MIDGRSPIWMAAREGHTTCISQLISSRADPRIGSQEGLSALDIALKKGHCECVRVLEAALT
jgi:ankyrin repeat protein